MSMVQDQLQQSMTKSSRQTRQIARRLSKLTEAQAAIGWGMILLLVALLGVIYLNQSSQAAVTGRRVQELQYTLNILRRENADIERDIAEGQTLSRLQDEAEKMGFIQAQAYDMDYVVVAEYPAAIPTSGPVPAGEDELAPPLETIQEALWLVVSLRLNDLMLGESRE